MAPELQRRLAAILSADVVGYSRLMAEDDTETVRALQAYRDVVALLVGQHRGRVVDSPGDNLLAEFPSALDAVQAAAEIQRVIRARNAAVPAHRRMEFRIGVHLGDVVVEGDRIFGDGVNIAARLEALAEPGGICISGTVHEQVRRRLRLGYEDLGERSVKNIPDPLRVYRLRLDETLAPEPEIPRAARWAAGIAALLVVAAFIGGWWLLARAPRPLASPGAIRSLAVLPLENLSGDPEQDYFTDGMTEALILGVAKIRSLRVTSRTSVMSYKGARKPLPEIARELNVDAIVEGSVLRAGDRVRIAAQLIHGRTDQHLWSESYERDLSDVLSLQGELAQAIAREIDLKLTPQEQGALAAEERVHPQAYEAYLRGQYFLRKRTKEDLERAIAHFEEAKRLDPGSALGYAGLASTYDTQSVRGLIRPSEAIERIDANVTKALELDDRLAEVYTALGDLHWWQWDWAGVEEAYERAIALNPSFATAHDWYGQYLAAMGRSEEALREMERARELDPLSPSTMADVCFVHVLARRLSRAREHCLSSLELDPNFAEARVALGLVHATEGRADAAIRELERAVELSAGGDLETRWLAWAHARAGDRSRASALVEELRSREAQRFVDPMNIAIPLAGLGDRDGLFESLGKAYDARSFELSFLDVLFVFDDVREDPRFRDLLRRVGLAGTSRTGLSRTP
jgi:class 3 adenylate cyclase/TolB-like protein/Tfp pilus assembly protein PilF